ncbi:MAG: hypothetical protein PHI32_04940 [Dysgonamonadaceae bacterium]|nr:hypothetical protein [Dysgonamonadaceae bacterium]MDD4729082.1 hypothetical protein [Dysgonamonadaceae bacterium]
MEKEIKTIEKETYTSPDIEVVDIVIEQNILQNASGENENNNTNDMPYDAW